MACARRVLLGLPRASLRSHVPSGRREAVGASPARRGRMRKFPVCLKKVPGRISVTSEKVPSCILARSKKFPVCLLARRGSSRKTRGETGVLRGVFMAVACFLGLRTSQSERILFSFGEHRQGTRPGADDSRRSRGRRDFAEEGQPLSLGEGMVGVQGTR